MYIRVRVRTGSGKEKFIQESPDHFEIWVKEKPERNMANLRILALLASHFKIPQNHIHIVNGHHHPTKLLDVKLD